MPLSDITEVTGSLAQAKRAKCYKTQRVFFMTPQTLENDFDSGLVDMKKIVLLVIDEAHRATGKYAYCRIIEQMEK